MKNKKIIIYTVVVLLLILLVVSLSPKSMQNDTFWSIKVGEKIVKEGVFGLDNFSIHEGLNYVAHHFLADVVIYIVYTLAGFTGLYILEIVLALTIALLLYLLNKQVCKNKVISIVLLVVQMILLAGFISVRAQMISFVLFITELLLLEKYKERKNNKYLIGLCIIPLLLANFHMGVVPLYFVILFVNIIGFVRLKFLRFETVENTDKESIKKLLIVALISLGVIFVNPYFIDGVIYPFKTFGNEFINSTIVEFQPYSMGADGGMTLIYICVIVLILMLNKKKYKLDDMILLAGTLFMMFCAIRYMSFFAIFSYVLLRNIDGLKDYFKNFKSNDIKALTMTLFIVIGVIATSFFMDRFIIKNAQYVPESTYPVKAVEKLKEITDDNTRIFNEYGWGSYIMLNDMKVYIDSRCDLYTKEYSKVEIANDYAKLMKCDKEWQEIINKYNLNTFLIPTECSLSVLLQATKDYTVEYVDEVAILLTKAT